MTQEDAESTLPTLDVSSEVAEASLSSRSEAVEEPSEADEKPADIPSPDAAISQILVAESAVTEPSESDSISQTEASENLISQTVSSDATIIQRPLDEAVTLSGDSSNTADTVSSIHDSESTTDAQEPLPFWATAEAERLERLERLKAEAIEEPEPESEPIASERAQSQPDGLGVEFDENFIWSAGVLAAQGRRPEDISAEEITWLKRLRQGLGKTRRGLINQLRGIVGQGPLNQDAVMEIESLLLQADVGIEATDYVIEALQNRLRQEALPPEAAIAYLKEILRNMLDQPYQEDYKQAFAPEKDTLNIWLLTGVNGAGKTTTIGKLAHLARKSDFRCLIAAADTFRAAAVEQVKIWGQRSNVEVIANPGQNTDPAAVVFDAISAARSRETELLLVDTAGRLQNKKNLMAELGKIRRILDKKAPDATIESLLVLDATLGQNGLRQAEVFSEAAKLSGVVLTKLDGTAKGGVALAVVKQLGLPIRFIGAGEGIEDLRPFSSYEFVEALLSG